MINYTAGSMNYILSKKNYLSRLFNAKGYLPLLLLLSSLGAIGQAPVVSTPTVSGVSTTTATLGGTVTGTLTHRGTRWHTSSPVGTNNQLEEASTTAEPFTQPRAGFPAATKIFFLAYARNGAPEGISTEASFFTEPTQLTGGQLTATATSSTAINLTFPAADSWEGSGATGGYVIFRNAGSAPSLGALADGAAPPADGVGNKIATITDGALTSFNNSTGLSAATDYYYTIIPFVWDGADNATYNYNISSPQTANDFTFATEPGSHATGTITATAVSSSQINLAFNSVTTSAIANADGYIVLIKNSPIVVGDLASLNDGDAPNAFGLFEAIVNSTGTNTYNDISGLSANTTYHYAIIPFNRGSDDQTYNYLTTTGFATGSATTLDIAATFVPIPAGTAPVPTSSILSAGVNQQVLTGFSVTSEGSQVINSIGFNYTGLTTQFTDEYLYRSTTPGSIGSQILADNSPDGNFDLTGLGAGDKTINSTPVYYYLVVDVLNSVNQVTGGVTVAATEANIVVATGDVNAFSINRVFTFNSSQLSDITFASSGTTSLINYRTFQGTSIGPANAGSLSLGDFIIRDGGASNDPDNRSTTVTSITIQLTNFANVRQIALFDDNADAEIAGTEQTVTGNTVTFTPSSPIVVADGNSFQINVRASFQAAVTDNQEVHITITGVTNTLAGSGFAYPDGGGATTSGSTTNVINVVASKLVFTANPPATAINQPFALTIRAVDSNPYNNIDLDYTGQVGLTKSPASGTLTAGAQSLTPNLIAGQFVWTDLRISAANDYTLEASDDAFADAIGDASGSVIISASASSITQPSTLNLCYGGIFKTLGAITITETDPSGFSSSGSFSIGLPTGYVFDTSVTTAPVISNGTASPTTLSYTGDNIVQFSYNFTVGSSNTNAITISGLKIRYPGNTAPVGGNNITRVGGTASIAGVVDGTVLGTLSAFLGTPSGSVDFTVLKINSGDVEVAPNETRFSSTGNAVRLVGTPTGISSEFTGPGVTFTAGQWRFNPASLAVGTGYTITYKVREGADQCEFTVSRDFEVYATSITNLANTYCSNEAPSDPLSVSEAYIDSRFVEYIFNGIIYVPTSNTYNFDGFVYYDPNSGYVDMTPIIPGPPPTAVWVFDPQLPEYLDNNIYSETEATYGTYGIWIGFRVRSTLTNNVSYEFKLIPVRQAPTATITSLTNTLFSSNSRFCQDQLPVVLTGSPANSDSQVLDHFDLDIPSAGIVSFSGGTSTWSLNPAGVAPTEASPVTFNITYTFTDKVTNCQDTSDPVEIRVYARPASVLPANISAFSTQEICPGTDVNDVTAVVENGTEYKWYNGTLPLETNPLYTGDTFSPPTDILTPGTTNYNVTRTRGKEVAPFFGIVKFAGCESNRQPSSPTAPFQVSVTVKPIPAPPTIPNLTREYCVNSTVTPSDLQVTGTNVKWYLNGNPIFTGASPTPANLQIDNTVAGDYVYSLTQTVNGCEGVPQTIAPFTDRLSVKIKPLPELTIGTSSVPDLNRICTTKGIIVFEGKDGASIAPNGIWSGANLSSVLNPAPLIGQVNLNPLTLAPGPYTIQYNYTSPATLCSRIVSTNFTILPTINVSIAKDDACLGSPVVVTNNSTMIGGGSIQSIDWDFDDNSGLPDGPFGASVNANDGRTTGTNGSPSHRYLNTGNYQIEGTMMTNDECPYDIPPFSVLVSPLPKINFTWENVCRDGLSNTVFFATELSSPQIPIDTYDWDFNLTNSLTYTSAGMGDNPTVNYNSDGQDSVQLIVTTAAGCQDSVKKPIYIVPKVPAITESAAYSQDFNIVDDNWLIGGVNPSWALGIPTQKGTEVVGSKGNVWETNLAGTNNPDEQSWVLSRCFNFTLAQKPVIALDIFSETPSGVNGAVLQYNLNGNIENDANWFTLGEVDEGINWYDATGISNSPGNQSDTDVGWTGNKNTTDGKYAEWRRAIYKLDELIGINNVVFRIAFAGGNSRSDGFAFDDVFIGERTRIVLLENFTNSSIENVDDHNDTFKDEGTTAEIVKVQYHTPFPSDDPINKLNPQMHNARSAFYGITESPVFRLDGSVLTAGAYDDRVLTPSPLKITITYNKVNQVVDIVTTVENISGQVARIGGAHLFTTIVEKSITAASLLGSSGNTEFVFVAKEMLPSPTGLVIPNDLGPGEIYTSPKIIWGLRNGDAIVASVQSVEGNNKEVHQAAIELTPDQPDIVTGIEEWITSEVIEIYPNPASESFVIELPSKTETRLSVNLIDPVGRPIQELFFEKGEQRKMVNTQELAGGIYVVQIGAGKSGAIRKKVMVVHKN